MYFRNAVLCKTLNQFEKIIIYGTGNFAQEIYPKLIQYGLKKKIVCFTQTDEKKINSFDGIPIININELSYNREECVVLIAVSRLYVDEIKHTLLEYDYPNIVSLVDYLVHYRRFEEDYSYLVTFEEYCEYIADWYIRTLGGSLDKGALIQKLLIRSKCIASKTDSNLIVVICGFLSARMIKIIVALKKKNYNIVMLEYYGGANTWCVDALQNIDIQIYHCECVIEMLYYALQYHPLVYFFQPSWGDCSWAEIMIKHKQHFGKIILGLYDIMNFGYVGISEKVLATEKYALEHADGIVWRWFFKEYLEQKGFQYQGLSLQFIDYCNCDNNNVEVYREDSSIIKLCYIVGYGDEIIEDRIDEIDCMDWARLSEILTKIGNRQDCIFHFYAGQISEENRAHCEEYKKQYTNFDYFLNTEYNELIKKMRGYDFGCDLNTGKDIPDEDAVIGDYLGANIIYSVRNSYADFLEAGLPIITTNAPKLWESLSKYDIVIKMNVSNLDIDYLKRYRNYFRDKVNEARKELNIDYQIPRLIQFFNEVSECRV